MIFGVTTLRGAQKSELILGSNTESWGFNPMNGKKSYGKISSKYMTELDRTAVQESPQNIWVISMNGISGELSFKVGSHNLGIAFQRDEFIDQDIYPAISIYSQGDSVEIV